MNGFEIERAIQFNKKNRERFGGIYNISNFKLKLNKRVFYVVNTSSKINEMGHWVLFIYVKNKLYFFDSFAKRVEFYGGDIASFFYPILI